MAKESYHGPLEKIDPCCWRIPKSYKQGMRVDGLIFANDKLIEIRKGVTSGERVATAAFDPTATSANPPAARYPNSPTSLLMCQLLAGGMPRDCRKCGGYSPGSGGVLEIEAARFYHVCLRCGCHLATRTPCVPPPYSADCWMG